MPMWAGFYHSRRTRRRTKRCPPVPVGTATLMSSRSVAGSWERIVSLPTPLDDQESAARVLLHSTACTHTGGTALAGVGEDDVSGGGDLQRGGRGAGGFGRQAEGEFHQVEQAVVVRIRGVADDVRVAYAGPVERLPVGENVRVRATVTVRVREASPWALDAVRRSR